MILEYKCSNFRSIGEEVTFSMLASKDSTNEIYLKEINNKFKCLREAVIYGANGSGKSNFIKSMSYLVNMIKNSYTHMAGASLRMEKHVLKNSEATIFAIHFMTNNIKYYYEVSFDNGEVKEESLYFFPNQRAAKIFERNGLSLEYGEDYKKELSGIEKQFLKSNRLMLSCAANYGNINCINEAFLFFSTKIVFYDGVTPWREYAATQSSQNEIANKMFIEFMNNIGAADLIDVQSKVEKRKLNEEDLPPFFNDSTLNLFKENVVNISSVKLKYEEFEIDINQESLGIQKLFDLFFPLIDIVLNDKILICDELENHLHPLIVKELISLFLELGDKSQMIFTTHDINILNLNILRRDQIWFTKKSKNNTELFSLAEIKSVRKDENISKNYLVGKYSGVPMIDNSIKENLINKYKLNEKN